MYRYRIYGVIIESEFEIKMLIPTDEDCSPEDTVRIYERDVEADVLGILADHNEEYYVIDLNLSAFRNIGGYYLIRDGREICVKPADGYTNQTITSWILGFCLSMVLLQRGTMTIHCSAVNSHSGAVLVSGYSGAGKSSMAGMLLESGCKLMADDVAAVRIVDDKCMVYPAFPFQKLCANEVERKQLNKEELLYIDEDKDKYLVPADRIFESEPQQLKYFFCLARASVECLEIHRLTGFDCYMAIKDNLFLDCLPGDWSTHPDVINTCMKIASKCEIYLIVRPDEADTREEMRNRVMEIIQSNGESI